MLLFAGLYPLVPTGALAAALLIPVNIFAAMPWGAANAAIAEAMPPRMRGQGSAIYQLVVNLLSGVLGPTAVALLTDQVFRDPLALRYSLSLSAVVGMTLAIGLLAWGRPAFRASTSSRLNSVLVSSSGAPSQLARRCSGSIVSLPTDSVMPPASSWGRALVRRRMARTRAVNSRGVQGLVT